VVEGPYLLSSGGPSVNPITSALFSASVLECSEPWWNALCWSVMFHALSKSLMIQHMHFRVLVNLLYLNFHSKCAHSSQTSPSFSNEQKLGQRKIYCWFLSGPLCLIWLFLDVTVLWIKLFLKYRILFSDKLVTQRELHTGPRQKCDLRLSQFASVPKSAPLSVI
jgi:hypothetical protein